MSEKTKLIVWSSVLGVVVLALAGGGYYFLWQNRIQKTKEEIASLEKEVQQMQEKKDKIPGLKKEKQELQQSIDEFKKALPSLEENTPEEFIEELHGIATNVGVNVTQYSVGSGGGPDSGDAGYKTITLNIQVKGEVYRLFRYIWSLENQERLMRVNSYSLAPGPQLLSFSELREIRGGLTYGTEEGTDQNAKIEKYIGTMNVTTTVYIYSPPS